MLRAVLVRARVTVEVRKSVFVFWISLLGLTAVLWALCAQVVVRARGTQGVHAYVVVLSILLDRYTLV